MKTLKPLNHYLVPKSPRQASIIFLPNFMEDGIPLSVEEGLFLGNLDYNNLQGQIPTIEKGVPKYIKVHPIIEVCYEVLASKRVIDRTPKSALFLLASALEMTMEEFIANNSHKIAMAKSILVKLVVDTEAIQAGINQGVGLIS